MSPVSASLDVQRKQLRVANSIIQRALRADGSVSLDHAAQVYASALSQWRKALVASIELPEGDIADRRAA